MRSVASQLADPEAEFHSLLLDPNRSSEERFAAFYGILQQLNREQRTDEYRRLCEQYEVEFSTRPYYKTFKATIAAGDHMSEAGLRTAMRLSEQAIARVTPDRPGILHQYSSFCASLTDLGVAVHGPTLEKALERVDRAIEVSGGTTANPNFHYTRARVLRALGRLDEAIIDTRTAIGAQETQTAGGVRRLTRFEALRAILTFDEMHRKLIADIATARAELRSARGDQVQLLGTLAAVIALITTAVAVSGRLDQDLATRFMVVTTGSVGFVFTSLVWASAGARSWRLIFPMVASLAVLALGLQHWFKIA